MKRRALLCGISALPLAGCVSSGSGGQGLVGKLVGPAADADTVTGKDVIAGAKRVAIAGFMVDFAYEYKMSADSDMAGLMFSNAPSNATITSKGIAAEALPGIADRMYDQFVQQATAAGYQVVAQAEVTAQPGFVAFAALGKPSPAQEEGSAGSGYFVGGRGLPLVYMAEESFGPAVQFFRNNADRDEFLPFSSRIGAAMNKTKGTEALAALAKALDATVVLVRITVAGGALSHDFSFWTGATVSTQAGISFAPFVTRLAFVAPSGSTGRVAIGKPVVTADAGELKDVTSGGAQAWDAVNNAAAIISRGINAKTQRTRDYVYQVDPARFETVVLATWPEVANRLIALAKGAAAA